MDDSEEGTVVVEDASAERREVTSTVEDEEVVVDTIHADVAAADITHTRFISFENILSSVIIIKALAALCVHFDSITLITNHRDIRLCVQYPDNPIPESK